MIIDVDCAKYGIVVVVVVVVTVAFIPGKCV